MANTSPFLALMLVVLASIAPTVVTGCGGGTTEEGKVPPDQGDRSNDGGALARDIDRSCKVDDDCAVVFVGDPCKCDCTMDAIAAAQVASFEAERGTCSERISCSPCPSAKAVCAEGSCALVR